MLLLMEWVGGLWWIGGRGAYQGEPLPDGEDEVVVFARRREPVACQSCVCVDG